MRDKNTRFPPEKILTVSARDYCDSKQSELKDYDLIGVHSSGTDQYEFRVFYDFQESVSDGAEVVVGFNSSISSNMEKFKGCDDKLDNVVYHFSGTALVPKKKS